MPVPLSATLCGLPGSVSLMDRVADCIPAPLGLNVKSIVQIPPPATLPPATHVELG